jgi:hypothetical protein
LSDPLLRLRRFMLAILVFGMSGSAAELVLLRHYEDTNQLIPLVLIGVTLAVVAWHAAAGRAASVRALQLGMLLFIGAGFAGVVLHFRSNMEFQLETDPSLAGTKLLLKVLQAKAPPALAPGVMVQLGLLGLAYTYRHPALHQPAETEK